MNYKKGDKVLLMAEIDGIYEEDDFPYAVNIHVGDNEVIDEYACKEEAIVCLYGEDVSNMLARQETKCSCLHEEYGKQVCYGTKEREECNCEGDLSKCNFYPERREMRYTSVAEEDYFPKYANIYNSFLNHIYGLKYYELLDIFDLPDHRFNNKAEILVELIMYHRPVELIRTYNLYRKQFVVCKNDVIEDIKDKKEYLVTKIENQYIHIISKDGDVRVSKHKYLTDNVYKKTGKNMTIQEFFSKEVQA